jgi:hypothetical protein
MDKTIHRKFIQALPSDNPYLADEYIDVLKETFAHRPELLEAYLYGSWDALEGADQIIKAVWLREAANRSVMSLPRRPRICCDPARFGDDETVIYYAETTNILEQKIMAQSSVPQTAHACKSMAASHSNCVIVVEATGGDIGAGVIDCLKQEGVTALQYCPQGKPVNPSRFYNLRAEAWSKAAQMLAGGQMECKFAEGVMSGRDSQVLIEQLTSIKYRFRAGKTLVELKEDVKKRLGRSPDRADCYVMILWSYDLAQAVPEDELFYADEDEMVSSYTVESVL